ncbi:hypothetical protein L2E82_33699 [Cichorium intybus]|uniref:Uncharacterized protein n=1 Tax=Cichorium intybus TaxID=13427 RepID=A0ACB9BKV5_CICIN|nr:hypothetical protein L2E82_33699 [Cichorium intybus]
MKTFPFALLLITALLFISSTAAVESTTIAASPAPSPTLSTFGCDEKCGNRCSKAGYQERCLKYCGICCGKCEGCVPSSPYANKAECPCYRDLKNSKGKSKCP